MLKELQALKEPLVHRVQLELRVLLGLRALRVLKVRQV